MSLNIIIVLEMQDIANIEKIYYYIFIEYFWVIALMIIPLIILRFAINSLKPLIILQSTINSLKLPLFFNGNTCNGSTKSPNESFNNSPDNSPDNSPATGQINININNGIKADELGEIALIGTENGIKDIPKQGLMSTFPDNIGKLVHPSDQDNIRNHQENELNLLQK